MSGNVGQLVLGIVGAVVGFVVSGFNPYGAALGWTIGSFAGGLIFPANYKGPNPNDVKVQNSAYGVPIPKVYGMYRIAGNVIWAGQPVKVGTSTGGKGGPTQTTYTYHIDLAIGLCEGEIQGIRRIWANSKLIYDISQPDNFEQLAGSNTMLSNFTVYPGNETQMPDPSIEAQEGAGNVSPNRGLAYIVLRDFDLGPYGSYIPSFTFEVVKDVEEQWVRHDNHGQWPLAPQTGLTTYWRYQFTHQSGGQIYGGAYNTGSLSTQYINKGQVNPYGTQVGQTLDMSQSFYGVLSAMNGPAYGLGDQPCLLGGDNVGFGLEYMFVPVAGVSPVSYPVLGLSYGSMILQSPYFAQKGDFVVIAPTDFTAGTVVYCGKGMIWTGIGTRPAYTPVYITEPGDWIPIGWTDNYLYCLDLGGTTGVQQIGRFNPNTLALDAMLLSGGFTLRGGGGVMGWVENDDEIYITALVGGNGRLLQFTPSTGALTDVLGSNVSWPVTIDWFSKISPNMFGFVSEFTGPTASVTLSFLNKVFGENQVSVASILNDICATAGLSPGQYDTSRVGSYTRGYCITGHTTGRDNMQPLLTTYFIDVSDADAQLKFVPRGQAPTLTLPYGDIGVAEDENGEDAQNPIKIQIADEITLPKKLSFTYPAFNSDYQNNTQYAFRTTNSNLEPGVSVPVVLVDNEAIGICQSLLWSAWLSRQSYEFQTSLEYIGLEPTDVIYLEDGSGLKYLMRLTKADFDGANIIKWTGEMEQPTVYPNPATYTAAGGEPLGFQPQVIPYTGPSVLAIMDMPPLRTQDTSAGLYVAACAQAGSSWPGCNVNQSTDGSAYTVAETLFVESTMGYCQTALGAPFNTNTVDETNTVDVFLYNGSLSSQTYADLLATHNNACVIGQELIYFRDATLIGVDTYRLSGLLRGRQNTTDKASSHQVGDQFVLLDATVMPETIANSQVGQNIWHKPQTVGNTDFGAAIETLVTNGRVACFAPYQFAAGKGSAASINDISLQWIRRARVNNEWLNGTNVPLDESVEAYTLTIANGAGVTRRVVTVTGATTYVYAAADITADGFVPGDTINFTIYQNSDQGVVGKTATTSIVRP